MVIQEHPLTCVSACFRQVFIDLGFGDLGEETFSKVFVPFEDIGGYGLSGRDPQRLLEIAEQTESKSLIKFGFWSTPYEPKLKDIQNLLDENNSVMVLLDGGSSGSGRRELHAVIVDRIENGQVFVRDPWGVPGFGEIDNVGATASLSIEGFLRQWDYGQNKSIFARILENNE